MLNKKIFVKGKIIAETGLAIGGTDVGLEIGGIDKIIVRHPVTKEPYIPGSSIRGKMRSLLDKVHNLEKFQKVSNSHIHVCTTGEICNTCRLFGVSADSAGKLTGIENTTTRLIVRDAKLTTEKREWLRRAPDTELPFTETKVEVVIDRITSQATPRTFERVPAGAEFELELIINVFDEDDEGKLLSTLCEGLMLLQDDYLGGSGSRGYGKVSIKVESVFVRTAEHYKELVPANVDDELRDKYFGKL